MTTRDFTGDYLLGEFVKVTRIKFALSKFFYLLYHFDLSFLDWKSVLQESEEPTKKKSKKKRKSNMAELKPESLLAIIHCWLVKPLLVDRLIGVKQSFQHEVSSRSFECKNIGSSEIHEYSQHLKKRGSLHFIVWWRI